MKAAVQLLSKVTDIFDRTTGFLAAVAAGIVAFILLAVCIDVVMRYFLNRPIVWQTEVSSYLLLYITFLGAAWVLGSEGHVKVEMVVSRVNPSTRAVLGLVSSIIGVITTLALTWYGVITTVENFQTGACYGSQVLIDRFLITAVIPVGSFFLLIQFMRKTYRYLLSVGASYETKEET